MLFINCRPKSNNLIVCWHTILTFAGPVGNISINVRVACTAIVTSKYIPVGKLIITRNNRSLQLS